MDLDSDYCSNESDANCANGNSRTPTPPNSKAPSQKSKQSPNSVVFIIGEREERVEVLDKQVLMNKSPVMREQLSACGPEVKVPEWSPAAFKVFLDYLQTDVFKYGVLSEFTEIIMICVKYNIDSLLAQVCPLAKQSFSLENCVNIFKLAVINELDDLRVAAYNFFLRKGNAFLEHSCFLELDSMTLSILISSDDFPIVETVLFRRLIDWVTAQCKRLGYPPDRKEFFGRVAGIMFRHVRYAQMTPKEFRKEVMPSGLLNQKDIEAIDLRHRTNPQMWHMLPPYKFIDRPRLTKVRIQVPMYHNVQSGFRKIAGASSVIQENLRFMVSHDIYLTGVGFFGPAKSDRCLNGAPLTAYTIEIGLEGDYTKYHWRWPPQSATVITRDNFMIDLNNPFHIQKLQPHKLTVWIDGEVTQFGVFPLPQAFVMLQDKGQLVTFHFTDADTDAKPVLESSGRPSSSAPGLIYPNYGKQYKEPRTSGVIRCICFTIKD